MGYTRYSVIFTGEALPDTTQADAVYIVLNPPYRELLNHVETRPLDYDYLKKLPPGPQRLYELLSFQIYGAIAGSRNRAKVVYSDYCKYAPQVRYGDFDHVKKQMYKLHVLHRESGYITKVEFKKTTDSDGNADWEMFYTPGPKAFAEYRAFTRRYPQHPSLGSPVLARDDHPREPSQTTLTFGEVNSEVLGELVRRGVAEIKARELLANIREGQEIIDQIEYVDYLIAKDRKGRLENPPGLLVLYIRDNIMIPTDFVSSRKARLQDQAQQLKDAELAHNAQLEIDYDHYRNTEIERLVADLPTGEYKQIFEQQRRSNKTLYRAMSPQQLDDVTHLTARRELHSQGRLKLLSFEDFVDQQHLQSLES